MMSVSQDIVYGLPWVPYREFFDRVNGDTDATGNFKVKCKMCLPRKELSCNTRTAANLKKHISNKHAPYLQKLEKLIEIEKSRKRGNSPDDEGPKNKQMKLDHFTRNGTITVNQAAVDKLIINFVIASVQPFSICDGDNEGGAAFNNLIKTLQPDKKVMCSKTLKSKLSLLFDEMQTNTIQNMSKVAFVSTTADCWSAAKRSYIGVTAHWINPENFERHQAALACQRLLGRHTFDVLATSLSKIFDKYKIQNKITGTTTDNGRNFVKAFRMFGESEENSQDNQDIQFVEITNILSNHDADESDAADAFDYHGSLPPHYRCASHTLNLVATKDTSMAMQNTHYKKIHRSTFGKCQGLWNKQNMSSVSSDCIKENLGVYLRTPTVTRWNSTFDACSQIKVIISTSNGLENLHSCCDNLGLPRFQRNEITFLKEYVEVMKPLAFALDILQKDRCMFLGYLLPTLVQTITDLNKIKERELQFCAPLLDSVVNSILKRFEPIWRKREFVVASCLHPKFKLDWLSPEKRSQARNWLIEEIELLKTYEMNENILSPSMTRLSANGEADEDNFFTFTSSQPVDATSESAEETLSMFLKNPDRSLKIFSVSSFKDMKELFLKYNTTLPSSASVERLFSTANSVLSDKRHGLTDEHFEMQLLLKVNKMYNNK